VRRALVGALAACALSPAVAPAQTSLVVARPLSPARFQRLIAAAAIPTPHATLVLQRGLCPGAPSWAAGCALPLQRQIWLSAEGLQPSIFFHELGHVFDWLVMTDAMRARFAKLIHRPGEWNWTATNRNPPVEQFAEAYSICARHRKIRAVTYGNYDYTPTPALHGRACALIRSAARHPASRPAPAPTITPTRHPCAARPRSRCAINVRRIDAYPDSHGATAVSGLVARARASRPTVPVDLARLTAARILAPFSLVG